jgi:hypothetical protein
MASVPGRVASRIAGGIKKFQPILNAAKARDVNESDTVLIITDILQEVLGYDKYSEITSEHAIRGTYCDLALRLDGEVHLLIEVKAIGLELKDSFVKQATDYAANLGIDWVVLTNGINWRTYKVYFTKPIDIELVFDFNFCSLNPKSDDDVSLVYLLAKEGWVRSSLGEYQSQRQALNRFTLAAMLLTEPIVSVLRREIRRLSSGLKVSTEDIKAVLAQEVLKREVLEGEKAEIARKQLMKAANKAARSPRAPKEPLSLSEAQMETPEEPQPAVVPESPKQE